MKRRDFLKGLTATSMAMLAAESAHADSVNLRPAISLSPANGATQRLNVFVHGMFAIVVDLCGSRYKGKPCLKLRAPKVNIGPTPHRYIAMVGNPAVDGDVCKMIWCHEVTNSASPVGCITYANKFTPSGDLTNSIKADSKHIILKVDTHHDSGVSPAWTIDLPGLPDDICQLRAAPRNYFGLSQTYLESNMNLDQWFPVLHVITYTIPQNVAVSFTAETGSTQSVAFDQGVGRIHLFAEPDHESCIPSHSGTCQNDGHLQDAINAFNQLFEGVNLTLLQTAQCLVVGPDSAIKGPCASDGILLCEERSLQEILGVPQLSCSKFRTLRSIQKQYKHDPGFRRVTRAWDEFKEEYQMKSKGFLETDMSQKFFSEPKYQKLIENDKPPKNCMSLVCWHR